MSSVPKLSPALRELRILWSPIKPSSNGVKEFISTKYVSLKKANPGVKFMLREADSISPRVYARFGFGKESVVAVDNAPAAEILEKIRKLTNM